MLKDEQSIWEKVNNSINKIPFLYIFVCTSIVASWRTSFAMFALCFITFILTFLLVDSIDKVVKRKVTKHLISINDHFELVIPKKGKTTLPIISMKFASSSKDKRRKTKETLKVIFVKSLKDVLLKLSSELYFYNPEKQNKYLFYTHTLILNALIDEVDKVNKCGERHIDINNMGEEYRQNIWPMKLCVVGHPLLGKTMYILLYRISVIGEPFYKISITIT